jgi:hypothetical protein
MAAIAEKIGNNTAEMLEHMKTDNLSPRLAAEQMARRRVEEAITYRRH